MEQYEYVRRVIGRRTTRNHGQIEFATRGTLSFFVRQPDGEPKLWGIDVPHLFRHGDLRLFVQILLNPTDVLCSWHPPLRLRTEAHKIPKGTNSVLCDIPTRYLVQYAFYLLECCLYRYQKGEGKSPTHHLPEGSSLREPEPHCRPFGQNACIMILYL